MSLFRKVPSLKHLKKEEKSLTAPALVAVVLAIILSVAVKGLGDALVPGRALPLVVVAGRAWRAGRASLLVATVAAVVVRVAAPSLQDASLVRALELVRLAFVAAA